MSTTIQTEHPMSSSLSTLEGILGVSLPDWPELARRAAAVRTRTAAGTLPWMARSAISSKRSLRRGDEYDYWPIEGGVALYRHPGLLDRLLDALRGLLAMLLWPLAQVQQWFDRKLQQLAAKLGPLFALLAVPIAFLRGLGDAVSFVFSLFRQLPYLVFSPFMLIREVLLLPVRILAAFATRAVWALLLPWVSRLLDSMHVDPARIGAILSRHPWMRGVLLGFLRRGRPAYPVLIPAAGTTQLLITQKRSLFGSRTFLVLVEGERINPGFWNGLLTWLKEAILPFYWERTAHVLLIPRGSETHVNRMEGLMARKVEAW